MGRPIAANVSSAFLTYRVNASGEGAVASRIRAGRHEFLVDEPAALAGDDVAACPVEVALGRCCPARSSCTGCMPRRSASASTRSISPRRAIWMRAGCLRLTRVCGGLQRRAPSRHHYPPGDRGPLPGIARAVDAHCPCGSVQERHSGHVTVAKA